MLAVGESGTPLPIQAASLESIAGLARLLIT